MVATRVARIDSITNGCQGGGSKKAGLVPSATSFWVGMPFGWRAALGGIATPGNGRGNGGHQNFFISSVNQLGGVGRKRSATSMPSDGVNIGQLKQGARDCATPENRNTLRFFYPGTHHTLSRKPVYVPPLIGGTSVPVPGWHRQN